MKAIDQFLAFVWLIKLYMVALTLESVVESYWAVLSSDAISFGTNEICFFSCAFG